MTGGASGIGKNIIRAFGTEGAKVIICDHNQEAGQMTEAELSHQDIDAEFLFVDLSSKGAPQSMVRRVVEGHGKLDVLVNNARAGRRTSFVEEDEDSWEDGMSVTLRAAFFASQEAIKSMGDTGGGSVVNVSSILGIVAGIESPVYHIAKAGMIHMTKYLAVEAERFQTRVNCVLPGIIVKDEHTERYQRDDNARYRQLSEFGHSVGRIGNSDDVASSVLFLSSAESSFITGQSLVVDGGLTSHEQSFLLSRFDGE